MRSDERDGGGGLGAVRRNVDKLGTFSYMGMLLTYFGLMQVALFFAKEKPVVRSELGRYDLGAFGTRDVGRFCAELAVVASLNWAVGAVGFVFACSDIHEADMRQITLQFATFFTLVSGRAVSVDGARVTRAARAAFAALRAYVRQDCFLFPYLTCGLLVVRATRSEFRDPRFFFVDVTFTLVAAGYACMVWSAMERDQRGLRNVTGLLYFCLATQTAKACSIGCQVATATEALVEQERGMYATAALAATRLLVGNAKVCIQPTLLLVVAYVGTGAGRDPAAFGRILAFYLGAVSACYAFGLATLCIPGVENQARDFWTNQSLFFCILPAGSRGGIFLRPARPRRRLLPDGRLVSGLLDYAGYGERRCAAYLAAVLAVMTTLSYLGLRRAPEYADLKATAVHDDGETAAEPPAPDPRDSSERR
ncbi:hypothetical protein JL721_6277 [Aureococcus anophagefferens]|nr:hypothetical protein JL721_6277 [Aureococcus anophagefferens]